MKDLKKIGEGKVKILYETDNKNEIIQYFKDDVTAFNNPNKTKIVDSKGIVNNYICEFIMVQLSKNKIPNHFIKRISDRGQLVKKVTIIPLEVIIRNVTAGTLATRLGLKEGIELDSPVLDLCYKNDSLGDPIINDDHAVKVLELISFNDLKTVKSYAMKINEILRKIFLEIDVILVDFKLEFGFDSDKNIILADEISPDSCRLWDKDSNYKLDKDRFRRGMGGLVEAYKEIADRLKIKLS